MLKITASNYQSNGKEKFDYLIERIMNLACVVAAKGTLPTDKEREQPKIRGRYWFRDKDHINGSIDRFCVLPVSNDYFAQVVSETETEIVLIFTCRYDVENNIFEKPTYTQTVENLILSVFPDNVKKID